MVDLTTLTNSFSFYSLFFLSSLDSRLLTVIASDFLVLFRKAGWEEKRVFQFYCMEKRKEGRGKGKVFFRWSKLFVQRLGNKWEDIKAKEGSCFLLLKTWMFVWE